MRARLLEPDWAIGRKRPAHISIAQPELEPLWIEVAADPAFVVGVLGMATVSQALKEISVAVRAADILGWSCTCAVDRRLNLVGRPPANVLHLLALKLGEPRGYGRKRLGSDGEVGVVRVIDDASGRRPAPSARGDGLA
jgi:hypothetical protein